MPQTAEKAPHEKVAPKKGGAGMKKDLFEQYRDDGGDDVIGPDGVLPLRLARRPLEPVPMPFSWPEPRTSLPAPPFD